MIFWLLALVRQEVQQLINNVKNDYPAVVDEINEKMSLGEIQKVLQNLLRERVSIRNMVSILEALSSYVDFTKDAGLLTEYARIALKRQIAGDYIDETSLWLHVMQPAPQNAQLSFTVTMRCVQWNEYEPPI